VRRLLSRKLRLAIVIRKSRPTSNTDDGIAFNSIS
jgi:hypothetical protein